VADSEPHPIDEAALHRQVVAMLRDQCDQRTSYKRLLALLGEVEGHAEPPLSHPRQ